MSNVINVNLKKNSYAKHVPGLVQWDRGQYLQIAGVDFSGDVEVHFSLTDINGDAKRVEATMEDGMLIVKIPQFIVEEAGCWMGSYNAFAWIYVTNAESAQTEYKLVLEVQTRPKPDDYVYTPEEVKLWSQLEDKLGELDERMPDNMSAEVGQMIVVKAVDENGKPTEWEAVDVPTGGASHWDDIEGKPFYEEGEETVLFDDEITFSPSGEMQGMTQIPYFEIEQGKTYKIDWNGHTYECTSKQFEIDGAFISYLGNGVLFEEEDTGENFAFYGGKDEAGENVSVAAYIPMTESKIPNERVIPCKIYYGEKIIHKLNNKFIDAEWMAKPRFEATVLMEEATYTGTKYLSEEETGISKKIIDSLETGDKVYVTFDGKEYECNYTEVEERPDLNEAKGGFFGNISIAYSDYANTGEPFLIEAYYGNFTMIRVSDSSTEYTIKVEKRKKVYDTIPMEYLPKGYARLGDGGEEEVIFEKDVTFDNEDGMGFGIIEQSIEFIEGDMYVLQLGETDYECVARSLTQTMDGVTATATWIGNAGIMGMENTGESFLIVTQPMGQDENGNLTYGTLLVTEVFLDENVPVKITHTTSTPTVQFDPALIPGEWKACKKIESFTIIEEIELTGNKTYGSSTAIGISFDKAMKNDLESASVIFNGTMYENVPIGFVPDELDPNVKQWYIGKLDTANNSYFSTFPFLITGVPYGFTSIYVQDTTTPYTIEAIGNKAVYDKIPDKYLPSDWNAKAEYEYTTTILDIEVPIYTSEHYDVEWQEILEQQKSVKVTFDGVLYECEVYVIYQSDGSVGEVKIGNRSLYNENHGDSGEPFYIERINWAGREAELGIYVADKTVTHTLLIKGQTNVNKIPDMFLPDTIARKEDLQNLGGGGGNSENAGLTTAQINALDAMFKKCAFTSDVSTEYKAFKAAFGLSSDTETDEPEQPATGIVQTGSVLAITSGVTATQTGSMLSIA